MKSKIALSVLIFFCLSRIYGQVEWFPIGAKWHYEYLAPTGIGYTKLEVMDGDTLAGGNLMKMILSTTISKGFSSKLDTVTEIFYVQEKNRIVSGFGKGGEGQQLYNFNAMVGDTLGMSFGGLSPNPFVVDSIGFIEINGKELAFQDIRFPSLFDPGEYYIMRVVEKIGSINYHLFHQQTVIQPFDFPVYNFRCYEDGELGMINFSNEEVDCNYIEGQLKENEFPILSGNIFPNPFSNYFIIQKSFGIWDDGELYNSIGQKVMAFKNTGDNSKVEIENLREGVYFVVLNKSGKRLYMQKLIKQ